MNYYHGNFYQDHDKEYKNHRGWLLGSFAKGARRTDKLEIKFWKFKKGEGAGHSFKYQKSSVECVFILRGRTRGKIGGKEILLKAGDYAVIPPGITSNVLVKVLENVEGLTIKAPSIKGDKVKLPTAKSR